VTALRASHASWVSSRMGRRRASSTLEMKVLSVGSLRQMFAEWRRFRNQMGLGPIGQVRGSGRRKWVYSRLRWPSLRSLGRDKAASGLVTCISTQAALLHSDASQLDIQAIELRSRHPPIGFSPLLLVFPGGLLAEARGAQASPRIGRSPSTPLKIGTCRVTSALKHLGCLGVVVGEQSPARQLRAVGGQVHARGCFAAG